MSRHDSWGDYTRLIAAVIVESPTRVEGIDVSSLAPGPHRELVQIVQRRLEDGRPCDLAALLIDVDTDPEMKYGGVTRDGLLDLTSPYCAFLPTQLGRYLNEAQCLSARDGLRREVERPEGPDAGRVAVLAERLRGGRTSAAAQADFIDWSAFWTKDHADEEWIVESVLARGRGHSIFAKHKSGKSLFALSVVIEAVRAGYVAIYLDFEMTEADLHERLSDMGCGPDTDLSRLRYALLPSLPPLNGPEGGAALMTLVDEAKATWPDRHIALIIDTISRAVDGEENSNDTIQGFYRHTGLALKQRDVTWLRLDHEGHEKGGHARGASTKGDDVDVIWRLAETDGGVELHRTAARMPWVPEHVPFRKVTEPVLRFERIAKSWPAGTREVAALLDELDVLPTATKRAATDALKAVSCGRRSELVAAAQRYRRGVVEQRETAVSGAGNHSGATAFRESGTRLGTEGGNPHGERAEPLGNRPEPTSPGTREPEGGSCRDPLRPSPTPSPEDEDRWERVAGERGATS